MIMYSGVFCFVVGGCVFLTLKKNLTVCENTVCRATGRLQVWVPANIAFGCQVVCGSLVFGRELIHIK